MSSQIKLTYYDFEARGETPRLVLHMAGIKFEDERLSIEKFRELQKEGTFKYDQVPVLQIGGTQYAQSLAIIRYLGKLSHMYPTDPLEQLECDSYLETCEEIFAKVAQTFVEDEEGKKILRKKFQENTVEKWLKFLNREISNSKNGLLGNKISVADLYLLQVLRFIKLKFLDYVDTDISNYKGLEVFYDKVMAIPKIKEWYTLHPHKNESKMQKK